VLLELCSYNALVPALGYADIDIFVDGSVTESLCEVNLLGLYSKHGWEDEAETDRAPLHDRSIGVGKVATLFLHGTVGTKSCFEVEQCAIGTAFALKGPDRVQDGGSLGECTPSLVCKDACTLKTINLVMLVANKLGAVFGTEHLGLHQDIGVIVFVVWSDGPTCHPVVKISGVVNGTAFL
jgi:hypothetical protein